MLFLVNGTFAQPPVDKAEQDKQGVFINRRPMRDFADSTVDQIQSGKINLEAPFRVVVSGKLVAKNKSIVLADAKIVPVTQPENSDPTMVKLAQEGILAMSDAGWFAYLKYLDAKNIVITVEQTGDTFSAGIRADQPSESRAQTAASSLRTLISLGKEQAKGDEKVILSAMTITSETDNIVIGLSLPKAEFHELVKRKIAESKTANTKVSGN